MSTTTAIEMSSVGNTVTVNVAQISGIDTTGSTDVTALINNENQTALSLHPGAAIVDNFGSAVDKYEIQGEVTLYSNMTMDGNGSTIVTDPKSDWQTSVGQFVNQDATPSGATPQGAPMNTNISIKGFVFYYPQPVWNVPIWIQNATGVDVQDNVFMAASNGQQFFINTKNAIIANNVSVGNINGAYNGWGGLQNVAVTNNYAANSGSGAGSGGFWFNATQNPYGTLGGGMKDVYAIGNTVHGLLPGGTAFSFGPLQTGVGDGKYDIFGSMNALDGIPSTFGYLAGNTQNGYMVYNMTVGYVAGDPEETTLYNTSSSPTSSGYPVSSNDLMAGNLAYGSTRSFQDFQASLASNNVLLDNALIAGEAAHPSEYQPLVSPSNSAQVMGQSGQLAGSTMVGGPVAPGLELGGTLELCDPTAGTIAVSGLTLADPAGAAAGIITLTATDVFGTLTDGTLSGQTISFSGDQSQVSQFLDSLTFAPGSQGWDDAIHLEATQGTLPGSVWDIAVNVGTLSIPGSGTGDYSLATNSNTYDPAAGNGFTLSGGETMPTLGGSTIVTDFAPVTETLSGTIYSAVVGAGGATITGTTLGQAGDISGIGPIDALLTRGGNDTITAGMAGATVNAATGDNLIQSNEGFVKATLGSGANTVVLGLAGGDITGGSGTDTIANLPMGGGSVNLTLGSGGGDVYLLSGDNTIRTDRSANSTIQLGSGITNFESYGNDTIRAGVGTLDLTVSSGANDFLMPGPGTTNIVGAGGNLVVNSFYTEQAVPNSTTLGVAATAAPTQTFVSTIDRSSGTFGDIGGAVFENSTVTASSVSGVIALANSHLTVNGSATSAGAAVDTIVASGSNLQSDKVRLGAGKTVVALDGSASVKVGIGLAYAGSITVDASGAASNTPFVDVDGGHGSVTFIGGAYSGMAEMTVRGGTAGNNLLEGNNAPAMLIGGGNGDTLIAGSGTASISGPNHLFAAYGNETLIATANTTDNLFQPYGGIDFESSAGSGTQYFFSGNDATTVVGSTVVGSTNILFFGNPSMGANTNYIENFRLGQDSMIAINNTSIQSVMAETFNGISGALVVLSDGTTAFFQDLSASSIESVAASHNFTQF